MYVRSVLSVLIGLGVAACETELVSPYNRGYSSPYNWGIPASTNTNRTPPQQVYHPRGQGGGPPPNCKSGAFYNAAFGSWTCADGAR
jgi:hypothetical protein